MCRSKRKLHISVQYKSSIENTFKGVYSSWKIRNFETQCTEMSCSLFVYCASTLCVAIAMLASLQKIRIRAEAHIGLRTALFPRDYRYASHTSNWTGRAVEGVVTPDDGAIVPALWDLILGQRGLMRNYRAYIYVSTTAYSLCKTRTQIEFLLVTRVCLLWN